MQARMLTVALVCALVSPSLVVAKDKKKTEPPPYQNTPVERFGEITPGLYRGAQPLPEQIVQLKKMGFRTILSFQTDEKKIAAEKAQVESQGMKFISRPLDGFWRPTPEQANEVQLMMSNPALRPLLIHCSHGRERTGLMTALYRYYYESWTPQTAYKEMKAYGFRSLAFSMKDYFEDATGTDL